MIWETEPLIDPWIKGLATLG